MCKKEEKQEHDLLGSLLDEDEQPKKVYTPPPTNKRPVICSAPPVLFDIGYKIDDDFLNDEQYDEPSPPGPHINEPIKLISHYTPQNMRKLSYQDPDMNTFELYEQPTLQPLHSLTPLTYYPIPNVYSPEDELFNNLDKVGEWAKDQHGSRTVQNILENDTNERKDIVFHAIYKDAMMLIKDRFGNYVFQKVFEKGLQTHKQKILHLLKGNIVELSLHSYGCRVVQKAIDYVKDQPKAQKQIIEEIRTRTLELVQNQNGNHVIQKCFEVFPHSIIQCLTAVLVEKLEELAFHMFGCRVIQKYLETNKNQPQGQHILKKLLEMAIPLSQCQYGNYVMQHIVTKCKEESKKIVQIFLPNIVILSTNKYASNVVEKAIQSVEGVFREELAEWFITVGQKELVELAKHQFGNYVVQSLLDRASKEKKVVLQSKLKENMTEISKSQYGRHVLMQMDKGRFK